MSIKIEEIYDDNELDYSLLDEVEEPLILDSNRYNGLEKYIMKIDYCLIDDDIDTDEIEYEVQDAVAEAFNRYNYNNDNNLKVADIDCGFDNTKVIFYGDEGFDSRSLIKTVEKFLYKTKLFGKVYVRVK